MNHERIRENEIKSHLSNPVVVKVLTIGKVSQIMFSNSVF